MKPLGYYAQSEQIDQLTQQFGSQLELLNRSQKLELRIVLTYLIYGQEQMGEDYTINDAWIDSLQYLICEDAEIHSAMEILQRLTVDQAEALIDALQAQCRHGNARLRTAVETCTEGLIERGVPTDLAKQVAYITNKIDPTRQRTEEEQATVNRVILFLNEY